MTLITIVNTTAGALAMAPEQVVPANGAKLVEAELMEQLYKNPIVKSWFDDKKLVPADDQSNVAEEQPVVAAAPAAPAATPPAPAAPTPPAAPATPPAPPAAAPAVVDVIRALAPTDFTASGAPSVEAINAARPNEAPISAAARDAIWAEMNQGS